jgi:single-stranded DNA-binding protein
MKQTITGVLTEEPQIRYSTQGVAQTMLEIRDEDGIRIKVVCYGGLAENVALSLTTGHTVTVVGELPPALFTATEVAVSLTKATVNVSDYPNHWDNEEEDN